MSKKGLKWKSFLRLSLKKKIVYGSLVLFLAIVATYSVVFGGVLMYTNDQHVNNKLISGYEKMDADIAHYFDQMDAAANAVRFNRTVQKILKNEGFYTDLEKKKMLDNSAEFLTNLGDVTSGNRFYLIDLQKNILNSGTGNSLRLETDIADPSWHQKLLEQGSVVREQQYRYTHTTIENWGVNIYYPITDNYAIMQVIGYLVICIPNENFSFLAEGLGSDLMIEMIGSHGQVILQNGNRQWPEEMPDDFPSNTVTSWKEYKVYSHQIADYNWNIQLAAYRNGTAEATKDQRLWIWVFLLFVPFTILLVVLGLLLSYYLTNPIIRCKDALLRIQNNEIGLQIDNPYYDEIGQLLAGFNEMSSALDSLIAQNKLMDALRRNTELEMLQQKINPHFLYNTLDLINGLIMSEHQNEAVKVCEMLGQMFRYNLKDAQDVLLQEEYDYVKRYLHIAKLKQQKLLVFEQISPQALKQRIPKMVLQPLIENAIKHGFTDTQQEYCLTLSILDEPGSIVLEIMDNGRGMNEQTQEQIRARFAAIQAERLLEPTPHVGVENIYHRLLLEYGSEFDFEMVSKEQYGTKVVLRLPKKEESKHV